MANKDPLLCLMKALQGFDTKVKKATGKLVVYNVKAKDRTKLASDVNAALKKEGLNERAWTHAQEKAVKELDKKFYKLIGKKGIEPYTYEASQMWTSGGFRKEMRKIFGKDESVNEDVFFESTTEDNITTTHIHWESNGKGHGYTVEYVNDGKLHEAEYQGRKVKLGKIMQGDAKKFKVYVKNPKGNVVKVNFGQGGDAKGGTMRIRKSNPDARKSFRARHNCDNPGPRHKARYWSCRKW